MARDLPSGRAPRLMPPAPALVRALALGGQPATAAPLALPRSNTPAPPPVTPMPNLNDPAVLAAQSSAMQAAAARSGVLSTILTGQSAGAPNYTNTKTGTG